LQGNNKAWSAAAYTSSRRVKFFERYDPLHPQSATPSAAKETAI
jgi:hypothetical protein